MTLQHSFPRAGRTCGLDSAGNATDKALVMQLLPSRLGEFILSRRLCGQLESRDVDCGALTYKPSETGAR